tara:strand:+ start:691 stop:1245 length:555 start_codon:yes stop_codon:yes gene_type:complete
MSDNNLLNEQTVRKFMKLAAIEPLTPGFVLRLQENEEVAEEVVEETTKEAVTEEEEVEEGLSDISDMRDEGASDEVDMDALDMGMDAEEPAAEAGGMVSIDQLMSALEKALQDVLGQEVEVSQDDELEMDAAEDEDMGAMDMSDEMPMADAGEEMADDEDDMDENALFMEKIYEKVLARLQEEK